MAVGIAAAADKASEVETAAISQKFIRESTDRQAWQVCTK